MTEEGDIKVERKTATEISKKEAGFGIFVFLFGNYDTDKKIICLFLLPTV